MEPTQGDLLIEWDLPHHNGSPLLYYSVEIHNNAGDFTAVTCQDSLGLSCQVSMADLMQAPYSLVFKQVITARVKATNLIGEGDWSDTVSQT